MISESRSPLVKHLVNRLRDSRTDAFSFRWLVKETAKQLLAECHDALPRIEKKIPTWEGDYEGEFVDESRMVCVSILRAALPMQEAVLEVLQSVSAGFLAMKRDETTHESRLYYDRVPDLEGKTVIVVDPMIATGGTLHDALMLLKERNPASILSLHVIAAKEGVERIERAFPDVRVHIAQIDPILNRDAYIVPGLGDAGDRAYGTSE